MHRWKTTTGKHAAEMPESIRLSGQLPENYKISRYRMMMSDQDLQSQKTPHLKNTMENTMPNKSPCLLFYFQGQSWILLQSPLYWQAADKVSLAISWL